MRIRTRCSVGLAFVVGLMLVQSRLHAQSYVANQESNNVSGYTINAATGALTDVSSSPFPAGGLPWSATVDPTGKYAYVANQGTGNVSGYTINSSTGALTPIAGSPWAAGVASESVAVDPTSRFAYVANFADNTVSAFTINGATGALTPLAGLPFGTGVNPKFIAVHPTGKFAYVVNSGDNTVSVFAINGSTGALTPIAGSPFHTASNPVSVALDPTGRFAFVVNNGINSVSAYTISTAGALTLVSGAPYHTGALPNSVTVDGTGRYVYVANYGDGTISGYTINGNSGTLTPMAGSPYSALGVCAASLAIDPTASFEYVADNCNGLGVLGYTINSASGALTPISGSPWAAGVGPFSITVRPIIPLSGFSVPVFTADRNGFLEISNLTLAAKSPGINLATQPIFLSFGTATITIPPGSLRQLDSKDFYFIGAINGVDLAVDIYQFSATQYTVGVTGLGLNLTGQAQPLSVGIQIGPNAGSTSIHH